MHPLKGTRLTYRAARYLIYATTSKVHPGLPAAEHFDVACLVVCGCC